jgi:hypothetical protein
MLCVAEFTIPPESFPFGETLVEMPDVVVTVDQLVPTDQSALPFFWVEGIDPEAFMEHAEQEADVSATEELERVGDTALFRAEWRPDADLVQGLKDVDATVVEIVGTAEHWEFEVRTADEDAFAQFRELFERHGFSITLTRLYDLERMADSANQQLTAVQRETLVSAYEEGYFDKPRRIEQAALADRFDVSRRAVAERLRRGTKNLVADTLVDGGEDASPTRDGT